MTISQVERTISRMERSVPREIAIRGYRLANTALRRRTVNRYLATHELRLLNIGADRHANADWLTSDLWPKSMESIYLDATKPWPIPSDSFDAVFCEHMIEHVPYEGGQNTAREAYRVLRDGGVFRIATPDMRLIKQLLDGQLPDYAEWANGRVGESWQGSNPVFAVNRMMRRWGHTFIYDVPTLTDMLTEAGFRKVTQESPGQSSYPHLRGKERHGELIGEDHNLVESMVFEAVK